MKRSAKIAVLVVFLGFIGAFFILNIVLPDVEFSQQENRYLQTLPDFSFRALFNGKFTADFEDYTTDQFAFRDTWTALKARCELLSGKKENNDVFYCGSMARDTASQAFRSTPSGPSRYSRRYRWPPSMTYSTSQSSSPWPSTTGFARSQTVFSIRFIS